MSTFVIYNVETTKLLITRSNGQRKAAILWGEPAAKACLTREVKKGNVKREDYAIAPRAEFFDSIEKKETRHGIASCDGVEYVVGVNTPWTSGPWSETYWSQ